MALSLFLSLLALSSQTSALLSPPPISPSTLSPASLSHTGLGPRLSHSPFFQSFRPSARFTPNPSAPQTPTPLVLNHAGKRRAGYQTLRMAGPGPSWNVKLADFVQQVFQRAFFRPSEGNNYPEIRIWGPTVVLLVLVAAFPWIFQFAVWGVVFYAMYQAFKSLWNPLYEDPFEEWSPPIRDSKWSDFDQEMQQILRTYKDGEVMPKGEHVDAWNRRVKKKQRKLGDALKLAKALRKARKGERELRGRNFLTKALNLLRIYIPLQFYRERYQQAKALYRRDEQGFASNTIKKPTAEAMSTALEQEDQLLAQDRLNELRNMRDIAVEGEVIDTTSTFGMRESEDLVPSSMETTRLWPKAVTKAKVRKADAKKAGKPAQAKTVTTGIESPAKAEARRVAWNLYGNRKMTDYSNRPYRFGIPTWMIVLPVASATVLLYLKIVWLILSFAASAVVSLVTMDLGPLASCTAFYAREFAWSIWALASTVEVVAATTEALIFTFLDLSKILVSHTLGLAL